MTVAVGLDVGTTGVKALAVTPSGDIAAQAEHGYPLSTPHPGWSEQDPEDWWRAAETALAEVSAGHEVVGIGLSGQMHGLVALDDGDRPLRPAILWNDQRTGAECEAIEAQVGLERLIELTGNRALPGFTAPKLLWLRHHEPDSYARISRICLPKDYVRLRLTGSWAIDVADASGTLLFDVAGRGWSRRSRRRARDPRAVAPARSRVTGRLRRDGDRHPGRGGRRRSTVRGTRGGDHGPGPASLVLGTSGVVFAALPEYRTDQRARVHVFCHAVPGAWEAMGVMLSAAGSLQWLHDTIAPDVPFDSLLADAERWAPGVEGLLFLPYLQGERTPHADPDARGAFTGLQLRHDRGALVRAVLEGVAFGLRDSLDLLRDLGVEVTSARVSGGGARSQSLARDLRFRPRAADRANGRRGGLGVRCGAARRRGRRHVCGRAPGGEGDRANTGGRRTQRGLARRSTRS